MKNIKKITLLLFVLPLVTLAQWIQVGDDIDGEVMNDQSGTSVALNATGNIVAIGTPFNDDNGSRSGYVRVFINQSGEWEKIGADINGNLSNSNSGYSVSISNDGTIVAIGAPDADANGFESGHVRIFENIAGNWMQIGDDIVGEAFSDHSGFSVSLSGDGTTVAIGAPDNEGSDGGNPGQVRVYENQAGSWVQIGEDIDGEVAEDNSGFSLALSDNGAVVAIGAPFNDGTDMDAGQVRIYKNEAGSWEQVGDDIDGEAMNDRFGTSVALSSDGTIVAIGARDNNSIGHVRVLQNQSENWIQIGNDIDGESIGDRFGSSVSLSEDGTIVAIGAPFNNAAGSEKGRVKLYKNQSGSWTQIDMSIDGEHVGDRFGTSVSLSADGSIVAIGAPLNDDSGSNSGHARIVSNSNILSVEATTFGTDFHIYPNPTSSLVTLVMSASYPSVDVIINDTMGKKILSKNYTNTDTIHISTENFAQGVYYINIYNSNTILGTFKLIKE